MKSGNRYAFVHGDIDAAAVEGMRGPPEIDTIVNFCARIHVDCSC